MEQNRYAREMPRRTAGGALLCSGPQEEKALIRDCANKAGLVLLLAVGLQFAVAFADAFIGMIVFAGEDYALSTHFMRTDINLSVILTGAEYLIYMGVPVLVGWLMFRRRGVNVLPAEKTDGSLGVGLVLLGFGMMTAANFIGSYISLFFELFNMTSLTVEIEQDGSLSAMWLNVLVIGVLPGLLEELLFRGVVLQGLRPAGDRVALVFSALMFGLMHGNMAQAPFAFVLGMVFGYITLKTGNILWTMGLHAANNALTVMMEYWLFDMSVKESNKFFILFFAVETLLGVIGMAVLMMRRRSRVPSVGDRVSSWLTKGQRRRALFSAGTVIAFIVIMVLITMGNMRFANSGVVDEIMNESESSTVTTQEDDPPLNIPEEQPAERAIAEVRG